MWEYETQATGKLVVCIGGGVLSVRLAEQSVYCSVLSALVRICFGSSHDILIICIERKLRRGVDLYPPWDGVPDFSI